MGKKCPDCGSDREYSEYVAEYSLCPVWECYICGENEWLPELPCRRKLDKVKTKL